jgi:hypothetical protein
MTDEKRLARALHDLADREEPGAAPVERLLTRGRRSRNARAIAFTAGSAVAVVAAAMVTVGVTGGFGPGSGTTNAVATTAAKPSLALAAQTSAQTTFTFTMTVEDQGTGGRPPIAWMGASDPANDRYSLRDDGGAKFHEERQIGDHCYQQAVPDASWTVLDEQCGRGSLGTEASLRIDPVGVLDQLKADNAVAYVGRTGSGATAVDTWKFSIPEPKAAPEFDYTYTGAVSVTVATNLVDTVVIRSSVVPKDPSAPSLIRVDSLITYKFRDYGAPVTIEVPE